MNMNYRVGFGGFLASKDILEDMKKDGLEGVGNFALTDQQTGLEWVQEYLPGLGGDKDNVTVFGLSAGGISIGNQLRAKRPPVFHRAIEMSGVAQTGPSMSLAEHEEIYQDVLKYFNIDGSSCDALEKLRSIPQLELANASVPIYYGKGVMPSPCEDGVFHTTPPTLDSFLPPPNWLKSYMAGNVRDEGQIFVGHLTKPKEYHWLKDCYCQYMTAADAEFVLELYGLKPNADHSRCLRFVSEMFGDYKFGIPLRKNLEHASSTTKSYGYHFDLVRTSFLSFLFHFSFFFFFFFFFGFWGN